MSNNYSEKLKHPKWQKRRLEILQRDNFTCQICHGTERTLHVHHRKYISGLDPWEYEDELLVTLCEECHSEEQYAWPQEIEALTGAMILHGYFSSHVNDLMTSVYAGGFGTTEEFLELISHIARHQEAFALLSEHLHKWQEDRRKGLGPSHPAQDAE